MNNNLTFDQRMAKKRSEDLQCHIRERARQQERRDAEGYRSYLRDRETERNKPHELDAGDLIMLIMFFPVWVAVFLAHMMQEWINGWEHKRDT
jgi:hypothetical protein